MKKLFTILALALATLTASAQTDVPNRMLIKQGNEQNPTIKAFAINKVQEVNFARVDGEIKATIALEGFRILKSHMYKKAIASITNGRTVKKSCGDTNGRNM